LAPNLPNWVNNASAIMPFKVTQGHYFRYQWKARKWLPPFQ